MKCNHCDEVITPIGKRSPGTAEQRHMKDTHGKGCLVAVSPSVKTKKRAQSAKKQMAANAAVANAASPAPVADPPRAPVRRDFNAFLLAFALHAFAFSSIEDRNLWPDLQFFTPTGTRVYNRKTLRTAMVERGAELLDIKLKSLKGQFAALAVDLGTTQGYRCMDVMLHVKCSHRGDDDDDADDDERGDATLCCCCCWCSALFATIK